MSVWQKHRINILRVLTVIFVLLALTVEPVFPRESAVGLLLDAAGSILLFAGVIGRFWCTLYIGGRKNLEVIDLGPYSICRHPLYFFSSISALGFGFLLGSVLLAMLIFAIVSAVLFVTASHEERYLESKLGVSYMKYSREVPRFFPSVRLFSTSSEVTASVAVLKTNFMDGLVFLSLLPLSKVLILLRAAIDWELARLI